MGGLKEDNKHYIFLKHSENVMEAMQYARHIQAKNMATHKSTNGTYVGSRDQFMPHKATPHQLARISHKEIDEIRSKGLCFGCNRKWSKEHKFFRNKIVNWV